MSQRQGQIELLSRLGLFIVRDFLDAEVRGVWLEHARKAARSAAEVAEKMATYVDPAHRRASSLAVPPEIGSLCRIRIEGLKPCLESHFGAALKGCETPQWLAYQAGDFFSPHSDGSTSLEDAPWLRDRRVSVVLFLNGSSQEPCAGSYGGGTLVFYRLMSDPRIRDFGFPLPAEPGLLVAFRSSVLHEVKPITWGERYVIVTWFI